MDKIWAPWREKYVRGKKTGGCIFCQAAKAKVIRKSYVIAKTQLSLAMLNIFPYNNGHLMVAPRRHRRGLSELRDEELLDLMRLLREVVFVLKKVLRPAGFNLGINLGKVAGAGVPGHLHVHIVPRWQGDTNFMPIVADTKVIPQSLDALSRKLRDAYRNL